MNRIFCTALPLVLHLLNTKAHLQNDSSLLNASSLSSRLQAVRVQCSRYPDWVRKVIKCLRLHFRDELEYILQAFKVVNNSLAQSFQESREVQILSAREDDVSQPSEEQIQICNWRELLDNRTRLYARLIKTLDTVISWGGPLPEAGMGAPFNECQVPPGSGLTRQFRAEKASLTLTPPVSLAPSRRIIGQRSQFMSYGDEPAAPLEAGATDSGFLHPEDLHESFSNIMMQKLDFPQSCLAEITGETYPPTSLDPSRGWAEEIADGGRHVLDQISPHENIQPIDFTDADDVMLGDGISDDWIDALMEKDISLQSAGQSAEDDEMGADMSV
jgi:hypothetical protein